MKRGQTSVRGGIEDVLFPMEILHITQGDNEGTHLGTYALDNAGKDAGIDPIFAPCTMQIMDKWNSAAGNDLFFQSVNKVRFADGSIDYLTCRFIHDDYTGDIAMGRVFAQGEEFSDEGTAGNAFGNHSHMEFGKGVFSRERESVKNAQGTWHLANNVPMEKVCFMDGTVMKSGVADWKYTDDVPVEENINILNSIPSDFHYEQATFTVSADTPIIIRRAPSTQGQDTDYTYKKGMSVNYDGFVVREGYVWISWISSNDGTRRWMSCGKANAQGQNVEPWGTFK